MSTVEPDPDGFATAVAGLPRGVPVTMLNLVRFREVAEYDGVPADCSGREAYVQRYAAASFAHVTGVGGEVLYAGEAQRALIGPPDEGWDMVLLVQYPSIEAFLSMVADPDYIEVARHRTAALADSRLVPTFQGWSQGSAERAGA